MNRFKAILEITIKVAAVGFAISFVSSTISSSKLTPIQVPVSYDARIQRGAKLLSHLASDPNSAQTVHLYKEANLLLENSPGLEPLRADAFFHRALRDIQVAANGFYSVFGLEFGQYNPAKDVRSEAVSILPRLWSLRRSSHIEINLRKILADRSQNESVLNRKSRAVQSLARIAARDDSNAISLLIDTLNDTEETVAEQAKEALIALNAHEAPRAALIHELQKRLQKGQFHHLAAHEAKGSLRNSRHRVIDIIADVDARSCFPELLKFAVYHSDVNTRNLAANKLSQKNFEGVDLNDINLNDVVERQFETGLYNYYPSPNLIKPLVREAVRLEKFEVLTHLGKQLEEITESPDSSTVQVALHAMNAIADIVREAAVSGKNREVIARHARIILLSLNVPRTKKMTLEKSAKIMVAKWKSGLEVPPSESLMKQLETILQGNDLVDQAKLYYSSRDGVKAVSEVEGFEKKRGLIVFLSKEGLFKDYLKAGADPSELAITSVNWEKLYSEVFLGHSAAETIASIESSLKIKAPKPEITLAHDGFSCDETPAPRVSKAMDELKDLIASPDLDSAQVAAAQELLTSLRASKCEDRTIASTAPTQSQTQPQLVNDTQPASVPTVSVIRE